MIKKILGSLLIGIILVCLFIVFEKSKTPAPVYREIKVQKGKFEVTVLSTGVVQPENRLEIKPPISGRIEKVLIKEGETVKKGQNLAWMSSLERAALLDAARPSGKKEIAEWEALYRPIPILAPISGTIISRNVEPGQTFTSQDAVFVMSDRLAVKAQVDETDISQVRLGQTAKIILDAYPKESLSGKVVHIAYEAKTVNNVTTYIVDVLPEETPEFMRSGMTANVIFYMNAKENVILLPSQAVLAKNNQFFVSIKPNSGSQQMIEKNVEVGASDGKRVEITAGLNEGDIVLVPDYLSRAKKDKKSSNPFSPTGVKQSK